MVNCWPIRKPNRIEPSVVAPVAPVDDGPQQSIEMLKKKGEAAI
jgi:hypothetical protein